MMLSSSRSPDMARKHTNSSPTTPTRTTFRAHRQYRLSAHRIGKQAMQRRRVAAGTAQPVNAGESVTVDSYEEALEREHSLQSASYISAANILVAFVAIKRFPHDGLDRRHFSIRQLGKLALATLAT